MSCATCANWLPKESGGMSKHRMALCSLGTRWTFYPPQHTCGKHKQATPQVVTARVTWLARSSVARPKVGG